MNLNWFYGGVVSGPVFREVADKIYASKKIGNEPFKINCSAERNLTAVHYYFGLKTDFECKIPNTFNYSSSDSV